MSETKINLGDIYREIVAELRVAELRVAELRGQNELIERLIQQAQRPTISGDPLDERIIRAPLDIQESRLGEAQQTLDVMEGR